MKANRKFTFEMTPDEAEAAATEEKLHRLRRISRLEQESSKTLAAIKRWETKEKRAKTMLRKLRRLGKRQHKTWTALISES